MNLNKIKYVFYGLIAIGIGYQVWKSEVKDNIVPQEEKDLSALEKIVSKNFDPEMSVTTLTLLSTDHLESKLKNVKVEYVKDNGVYANTYTISTGDSEEKKVEEERSAVTAGPKTKVKEISKPSDLKTVKIKDFKLSLVSTYYAKAVKEINEEFSVDGQPEFQGFVLRQFTFEVNNEGKIVGKFMIEGTQVGEGKKTVGRTTYTNYYEFAYLFDDKGELVLLDDE